MRDEAIFDHLLYMDDPVPRDAALNMAIDETLLSGLAAMDRGATPLLRIYRWDEPTISIGYFESVGSARVTFPHHRIVRRWTGGGLVAHGHDLTYSLLVPPASLPAEWRPHTAYQEIHSAVAAALRAASLAPVTLEAASTSEHPAKEPWSAHECFQSPVTFDVMHKGRKIAGAAQRRTRYGLLHQGSIQGHVEKGKPILPISPGSAVHAAVSRQLPIELGACVESRALTAQELTDAMELSATRYGASDWLERF